MAIKIGLEIPLSGFYQTWKDFQEIKEEIIKKDLEEVKKKIEEKERFVWGFLLRRLKRAQVDEIISFIMGGLPDKEPLRMLYQNKRRWKIVKLKLEWYGQYDKEDKLNAYFVLEKMKEVEEEKEREKKEYQKVLRAVKEIFPGSKVKVIKKDITPIIN